MLETYFNEMEIAEELGIPNDAVKDLLEDRMDITKTDIDKLLTRMVKKMTVQFAS